MPMSNDDRTLPDFRRPPVVEIVAAVQFAPLPRFEIEQVVALGHGFDDWTVVEAPPAIPPMSELAGARGVVQQLISFGTPPVRAILSGDGGRWTGQIQQDRIAVHERKVDHRPSFGNVGPMLKRFCEHASSALGSTILVDAHPAEIVEVIYENHIVPSEGAWSNLGELHRVLRVMDSRAGDPPYDTLEQATIAFSYALGEGDAFHGRLRVSVEPRHDTSGPAFGLRVTSRRLVHEASVDTTLESCHSDIVRGFTAITTEAMHEVWERYR